MGQHCVSQVFAGFGVPRVSHCTQRNEINNCVSYLGR